MGGTKRFLHGDEMKKCGHKPMLTPNIGAIATKASKARALPKFWVTVNPISTKGGRLCPPQYYGPCLAQIRHGAPENQR